MSQHDPNSDERMMAAGYRQGIITAITVLLGFSLAFLRFWGLEAPGDWTIAALFAAVLSIAGIGCLSWALWRSLQPEDDKVHIYRATLRWFDCGLLLTLAGVAAASIASVGLSA